MNSDSVSSPGHQELNASDGTVPSAYTKIDAVTGVVFAIIDPHDIRCRRLCVNVPVDDLFIDEYYPVVESSDFESQPELDFSFDEDQSVAFEGG